MSSIDGTVLLPTAMLAIVGTGLLTITLWRRRAAPTATPLLGAAVSLLGCVVGYLLLAGFELVGVATVPETIAGRQAFSGVTKLFTVLTSGFWVIFAVGYTGWDRYLRRIIAGVVGCLWALALAAVLIIGYRQLVGRPATESTWALITLSEFFLSGLAMAGVFLVLGTALRRTAIPLREGGLLSVGTFVFVFAGTTGEKFEQLAAVPVLFFFTSVAFLLAIYRFPVFETIPAIRLTGRDRLVEEMDAGLIVTNRSDRIDDLNPAAMAMFGVDRTDVLGQPVTEALMGAFDPLELSSINEPRTVRATDGRMLSVIANRITDTQGNLFGHTILCQDVTRQYRREDRLSLLTQFLVGTVRDRLVAISDRAATLAEQNRDESDGAERDHAAAGKEIREATAALKGLVANVRDIENGIATEQSGDADVAAVLKTVERSIHERDALTATLDLPASTVRAGMDDAVLQSVFTLLLEDAARTGPTDVHLALVDSHPPAIQLVFERRVQAAETDTGSETATGSRTDPGTRSTTGHVPGGEDDKLFEAAELAVGQAGGAFSATNRDGETTMTIQLPPSDNAQSDTNGEGRSGQRGGAGAEPGAAASVAENPQKESER